MIKYTNICVIGATRVRKLKKIDYGAQEIFEEKMARNFPMLTKY